MRENPVQIEVSRQKILMLGQEIGFVEIRQTRHRGMSSRLFSLGARAGLARVAPPSTTKVCPVM
jgi:hypothetical protein